MKIRLPKKLNILSIEDEFAQLVNTTNDLYCYEVWYQINPVLAAKHNAFTVRLTVRVEANETKLQPISRSKDNIEIIGKLLNDSSYTKDVIRGKKSEDLFVQLSDATCSISNEIAATLTDQTNKSNIQRRMRTFKLATNDQLKKENIEVPVLQSSLRKQTDKPKGSRQLKQAALNLLSEGIDPAIIGTTITI
jgi:hypothetical protein